MPGKSVIVDTNALLIPGEFGVDIFAELERLGYTAIIVPRLVLNELEALRARASLKGKERRAAAVGYALLQDYVRDTNRRREQSGCTVVLEPEVGAEGGSDTDTALIRLAARRGAAVLTNDELLRRRLTDAGIVTVYLRGRTILEERE
ncbi:MAG TPA: DNA-binding protein [Methanomicrobia archaeon]|nr:DNA-binding protein [Methanomicrobia archaeon]